MKNRNVENSREFTRVPLHVAARIKTEDEDFDIKQTLDLSMKGVFLESEKVLPVGSECEVSLCLSGSEPPIKVWTKGKVRRSTDSGMAIEFSEVDMDSYEHLTHLVMYNSKDSTEVEKEIKDHLGLKKRD